MVVVDKNTKLAHFILTNEIINSNGIPTLYLHHVRKYHGTHLKKFYLIVVQFSSLNLQNAYVNSSVFNPPQL